MVRLFHGTSFLALEKMKKTGKLVPQGSNGSLALEAPEMYKEADYKGYLFFTDKLYLAVDYASMAVSNTGKYIKNFVPILEVEVDELQLEPDVMDSKDSKTWGESLEDISQVRCKGELPLSAIKKIIISDFDSCDAVVSFENLDEAIQWVIGEKSVE